ncbi:SNF2 helicase associated domain-containing protein [Oceanobacillus iheyensis]|uniref:SNF2 helicase associated domain-containing protein n=1 Tax=Oceanobacillus iheyensis TaxID=182710 RepID=UPI003641F760
MYSLTKQKIRELCGDVSFKYGERLWNGNRVHMVNNQNETTATVTSTEDFQVQITWKDGEIKETKCNCPSLTSFKKDCQHIAAVLIGICETSTKSINRTDEIMRGFLQKNDSENHEYTHQGYFEKRQEIHSLFRCHILTISKNPVIAISIDINHHEVKQLSDFLLAVQQGKSYKISNAITYSPSNHYFNSNDEAIIHHLIQLNQENYVTNNFKSNDKSKLVITPTIWNKLETIFQLAVNTELIIAEANRNWILPSFSIVDNLPPLHFEIEKAASLLRITWTEFQSYVCLPSYRLFVTQQSVHILTEQEVTTIDLCDRLWRENNENSLLISLEQAEQLIPLITKIAKIDDTTGIIAKSKKPLTAKIYLDRISNRLLAGVEFHYGGVKFQPFEPSPMTLYRQEEKEEEIIQFLQDKGFAHMDGGYVLQNEKLEYEFLYHHLSDLQNQATVFATTAVRNRLSKKHFQPTIRVRHKSDRTNWLEFTFQMKGFVDQEVREVLDALEEKRPYYRLKDGSLLSLETKELEELQSFLIDSPMSSTEILEGLEKPLNEGFTIANRLEERGILEAEDSFKQMLLQIQQPDEQSYPIPKPISSLLKDYQLEGVRWMRAVADMGFGGVLADEMGLGKTIQSIAYCLSIEKERKDKKQPILIVCPTSVCYQWKQEWMTFAPDWSVMIIDGTKAERKQKKTELRNYDVWIISYGMLRNEIDWLQNQVDQFHTVIFDEAQVFKNPATHTFRTVKKLRSEHRFALTGTPLENKIEDIWSIFHVVFPELLGNIKDFSWLTNDQVIRRITPFMLRREKKDVMQELPTKVEYVERISLTEEQKQLYVSYLAKLRHPSFKHLDKETIRKNRIKILAGITRLRQICCHPSLFVRKYNDKSAKLERLKQLIKDASRANKRLLIFSQFTSMLQLIGKELRNKDILYYYIDGETPAEERVEICRAFNQGNREVCLISLKAGGTGLNLVGADTVILYDVWWNPAVEEQAIDRAHRIGQQSEVTVIRLLSEGTIEEKMYELQRKKRELMNYLVNGKSTVNYQLTDEDIQDLLFNETKD